MKLSSEDAPGRRLLICSISSVDIAYSSLEVNIRISKAGGPFTSLKGMWKSSSISHRKGSHL